MCAGDPYLLKLPTLSAPRVTFNELLGVAVADLASIPTAPHALVRVESSPVQMQGGEYFGSLILGDHAPLSPSYTNVLSSDETDELYSLLALDLLILNNDRKFSDLLRRGFESLNPIDYGNALSGANWTAEHLNTCHDSGIDVNDRRIVYCTLDDERRAARAAEQVAEEVRPRLLDALNEVCSLVQLSEVDREAVRSILAYRLESLERIASDQMRAYKRA
jgi:hypothetical protein